MSLHSQKTLFSQACALPTKRTLVSWGLTSSFRKNKHMQIKITLAVLCFVEVWSEKSLVSRKKRLTILNIQNDQSFTICISSELRNVNAITKARQEINSPNSFNSVGGKIPGRFFLLPLEHFSFAQHAFYNSSFIFSNNVLSGFQTLPSFST